MDRSPRRPASAQVPLPGRGLCGDPNRRTPTRANTAQYEPPGRRETRLANHAWVSDGQRLSEVLVLHPLAHVSLGILLRPRAPFFDHGDKLPLVLDRGGVEVRQEGPALLRFSHVNSFAGDSFSTVPASKPKHSLPPP